MPNVNASKYKTYLSEVRLVRKKKKTKTKFKVLVWGHIGKKPALDR